MAIRITSMTDGDSSTIRVEGRLDQRSVSELLAECRSAGGRLKLDLSGLMSVDAEGAEAIRSLAAEGAELSGLSAYICQLLQLDIS